MTLETVQDKVSGPEPDQTTAGIPSYATSTLAFARLMGVNDVFPPRYVCSLRNRLAGTELYPRVAWKRGPSFLKVPFTCPSLCQRVPCPPPACPCRFCRRIYRKVLAGEAVFLSPTVIGKERAAECRHRCGALRRRVAGEAAGGSHRICQEAAALKLSWPLPLGP